MLEAERLEILTWTDCTPWPQDMTPFGRDRWSESRQLYCSSARKGARVELRLPVLVRGRVELEIAFTRAPDYGVVEVSLDGKPIGRRFDAFHPTEVRREVVPFGAFDLAPGNHRLRFRAVGKHPDATGYNLGIDCVVLRPAK